MVGAVNLLTVVDFTVFKLPSVWEYFSFPFEAAKIAGIKMKHKSFKK
jgi:hypothetical protein